MDQNQRNGGGLIGGLAKGAGFVIGLGTELHAHNKAKKSSSQSIRRERPQKSTAYDETYLEIGDNPPTYDEARNFSSSLDRESPMFDEKLTHVDKPLTIHPLPYPVILPQRRPNDKSRGFVRAYAPDLGKYKGIEESTFLNFLKQFHKSSQASGIFMVINIAAMGAGFAPSAIAMAVTTSVQMASTAAAEAQSRYRTNAFLDKANEDLFHPRNLHCMVMTFKPEASGNVVLSSDLDKNSSIGVPTGLTRAGSALSNASNTNSGTMGGGKFRTSDGVTEGEFMLPQSALLVYPTPTPSEASSETDENGVPFEKKESSWKSTGKFLADYKDRRAQAKYAATYGHDSKLAVPGATDSSRFASKFSDPNANPLDFMSGLRDDRNRSRRGDSRDRSNGEASRDRGSSPGLIGGMKKMMQQNILYLLIAEMPSEEKMRTML